MQRDRRIVGAAFIYIKITTILLALLRVLTSWRTTYSFMQAEILFKKIGRWVRNVNNISFLAIAIRCFIISFRIRYEILASEPRRKIETFDCGFERSIALR